MSKQNKENIRRSFNSLTQNDLNVLCEKYAIGVGYGATLPGPRDTILNAPPGKIGVYAEWFEFSNLRLPFSRLFLEVCEYFKFHPSQMNPLGALRLTCFEVQSWALGYTPTVTLFRTFYKLGKAGDWFTFDKRRKPSPACSSGAPSGRKNWKTKFFFVNAGVAPIRIRWKHKDESVADEPVKEGEVPAEAITAFTSRQVECRTLPEHVLVMAGLSRFWTSNISRPCLQLNNRNLPLIDFLQLTDWTSVKYVSRNNAEGEETWLVRMNPRVIHMSTEALPLPYTNADAVFPAGYKMRDPTDEDFIQPAPGTIMSGGGHPAKSGNNTIPLLFRALFAKTSSSVGTAAARKRKTVDWFNPPESSEDPKDDTEVEGSEEEVEPAIDAPKKKKKVSVSSASLIIKEKGQDSQPEVSPAKEAETSRPGEKNKEVSSSIFRGPHTDSEVVTSNPETIVEDASVGAGGMGNDPLEGTSPITPMDEENEELAISKLVEKNVQKTVTEVLLDQEDGGYQRLSQETDQALMAEASTQASADKAGGRNLVLPSSPGSSARTRVWVRGDQVVDEHMEEASAPSERENSDTESENLGADLAETSFVPAVSKIKCGDLFQSETYEINRDLVDHLATPAEALRLSKLGNIQAGWEFDFALASLNMIGPDLRHRMESSARETEEQRFRALEFEDKLAQAKKELAEVLGKKNKYRERSRFLEKEVNTLKASSSSLTEVITEELRTRWEAEHQAALDKLKGFLDARQQTEIASLKAEHEVALAEARAQCDLKGDILKSMEERLREQDIELARLRSDRGWLVTMGPKHVVKKLHSSLEYSRHQTNLQKLNYRLGCHDGVVAGVNLGRLKQKASTSPFFNATVASELERAVADASELNYPYLEALSATAELPIESFQAVEPAAGPSSDEE